MSGGEEGEGIGERGKAAAADALREKGLFVLFRALCAWASWQP